MLNSGSIGIPESMIILNTIAIPHGAGVDPNANQKGGGGSHDMELLIIDTC
jgi:hypothetical protein